MVQYGSGLPKDASPIFRQGGHASPDLREFGAMPEFRPIVEVHYLDASDEQCEEGLVGKVVNPYGPWFSLHGRLGHDGHAPGSSSPTNRNAQLRMLLPVVCDAERHGAHDGA